MINNFAFLSAIAPLYSSALKFLTFKFNRRENAKEGAQRTRRKELNGLFRP